jgi:hypothetical protein
MLEEKWTLNVERRGPIWSWFDAEAYARHDLEAANAARMGEVQAFADYSSRGAKLGHSPNLYFDAAYYLKANQDLRPLIGTEDFPTAFDHYRLEGWRNRDPHWLFRINYYARYKDLTPDRISGYGGLYAHFLNSGAAEGRTAHYLFQPNWYLAKLEPAEREPARPAPFRHFLSAFETAAKDGRPEPLIRSGVKSL